MKKVIITLSLAILGIAAIESCDKKANSVEKTANEPTTKMSIISDKEFTWTNAANPDNPYDNIGYMHNKEVFYILGHIDNSNPTTTDAYNAAINFSLKNFGEENTNTFKETYSVNDIETIANGNFNDIIESLNIASEPKYQLKLLIDDISDSTYKYADNYDSLKAKIVKWENGILESSYEKKDMLTLLGASSILRYSLLGWSDGSFASTGSEGAAALMKGGFWKKVGAWLATAALDAVGGGMGAVAGGPVMAIVLGAATSVFFNT